MGRRIYCSKMYLQGGLKLYLLILLASTLVVAAFSCKETPTEKIESKNKSVREMEWTADTVAYPGSFQTLMSSIWASAPNDVYICGWNSAGSGSLWHFDGATWKDVKLFEHIEKRPLRLSDVNGISNDKIWVCGFSYIGNTPNTYKQSLILFYNGSTWIEQNVKTRSEVYSIYANKSDDVWGCGLDGIVYHFNGSEWKLDTIKTTPPVEGTFQLRSIRSFNNSVYILAAKMENNGGKQTDYFYKLNNNKWELQDSFITSASSTTKWGNKLYKSSYNTLYSYGTGGIYTLNGNTWVRIFPEYKELTGIYCNNPNDILIAPTTSYSKAVHYNGMDWVILSKLVSTDLIYSCIWMNEKEAFIVAQEWGSYPQKSIVFHGN